MGLRAMRPNILYRSVHTGPRLGMVPGPIVSFCPGPVPVPVPRSMNKP